MGLSQFDYEVGIRTVSKPGFSDSSVLKLDNGRFITFNWMEIQNIVTLFHTRDIGLSCRSVRNSIVWFGAEPIGIVDHLHFGIRKMSRFFGHF